MFGVYAGNDAVSSITDYDPDHDQIRIDFAQSSDVADGTGTLYADADNFDMSYDAGTDLTTVSFGGQALVTVSGDQTSASVAVTNSGYANYDEAPVHVWRDLDGNDISPAQGGATDIILFGYDSGTMYGT